MTTLKPHTYTDAGVVSHGPIHIPAADDIRELPGHNAVNRFRFNAAGELLVRLDGETDAAFDRRVSGLGPETTPAALADQPACPTFGVGDRVRVVSLPDSQSHGSMPDAALGAFGRISMIATVRPGDPPLIAVRLYDFNGLWWFSPENLEHPPAIPSAILAAACPFTTTEDAVFAEAFAEALVRAGHDVVPGSVSVSVATTVERTLPAEILETACDYCGGSGSGKIVGRCPVCRGGRDA